MGGRRAGNVLEISQAPDRQANYLDHSETELVLQTINETEVGVSKPNRSGLKLVSSHQHIFTTLENGRP
jgi:hypothetical protein